MLGFEQADADRWQQRGFLTYNTDYRPKSQTLPDVTAVYDYIRSQNPDLPIVASGQSAGGQLAMMLGRRRQLAAAISQAGPADLLRLPVPVREFAEASFGGPDGLRRYSPGLVGLRSPTLAAFGAADIAVPPRTQAPSLRRQGAKVVVLPAATQTTRTFFIHAYVDSAALPRYYLRERRFVEGLITAPS
jgi:acetyl esterase/lipase